MMLSECVGGAQTCECDEEGCEEWLNDKWQPNYCNEWYVAYSTLIIEEARIAENNESYGCEEVELERCVTSFCEDYVTETVMQCDSCCTDEESCYPVPEYINIDDYTNCYEDPITGWVDTDDEDCIITDSGNGYWSCDCDWSCETIADEFTDGLFPERTTENTLLGTCSMDRYLCITCRERDDEVLIRL